MTSRDFAYWLQGYFEIHGGDESLTKEQAECIKKHLALVFVHEIDPSAGPPAYQAKLDAIHHGIMPPPKPPTPVVPSGNGPHDNYGHGFAPGTPLYRC